jgi:hypothetical protein
MSGPLPTVSIMAMAAPPALEKTEAAPQAPATE